MQVYQEDPVEKIYLEASGSGYSANDIIIFEDEGTEGGGAEAIISAVGDEITLENASALDQYELIATAVDKQRLVVLTVTEIVFVI